MSGHSKWSTIKHKKAKEDSARGKKFTKLIKEITIAARDGGGDPSANPRLRLLLEKAKEINMPADNTMRAIKRGTGEMPGVSYEAYSYEGYGPGKCAIIIDMLTDNKNRAISNIRNFFGKHGGVLAESGSVSWMFDKLGVIRVKKEGASEDALIEELLEYDIKDIYGEDGMFAISCDMAQLDPVKHALEKLSYTIESADLEYVPKTTIPLDSATEEKAYEFLQALEDLDDVQNVYTNIG
jgi:YebC/PmpR family DNA-binding regulatory protein